MFAMDVKQQHNINKFYSMLASPSSLTLEVRVMFFELCVHDGHAPVMRSMLSGDSSCFDYVI